MNRGSLSDREAQLRLSCALDSLSWRATHFLRVAFYWFGGPIPRVTPVAGLGIRQWQDLQSSLSWRLTAPLRLVDRLTGGRIARGCGGFTRNRNIPPAESATGTQHAAGAPRFVSTGSICLERVLRPRCAVVVMVRDEEEIVPAMMQHLCALFDVVVVLDHMSRDKTGEIVAGYHGVSGVTVITMRSTEPGHYQSEYLTDCARVLIDQDICDWVFFLDADEFLPFASKSQFHQSLVSHTDNDVIHFNWINCFPDGPLQTTLIRGDIVTGDRASGHVKVAINANRLKGRECIVGAGNHAVILDGRPEWQVGRYAGGILHFPVRSSVQLQRKLGNAIESHQAAAHPPGIGWHWREMAENFDAIREDPALLRLLALRYGEPFAEVLASHRKAELASQQTRAFKLKVALVEAPECVSAARPRNFDRTSLSHELRSLFGGVRGKSLPAVRAVKAAGYGRLPPHENASPPLANEERLARALLAAVQPLQVLVFSAWAGHEPFLFTLMDLMRPRRYVELGVHEGQSFFTACQHYKSLGGYGEAVGIDLWEGDHQAGFYDGSIFSRFRSILAENYAGCGRYLRSSFADAATIFDPESIDLLHIDGLHTYEAVAADYRTWRSKLTQDGVILLHDTREFHSDFGVWRLMEEVKSEATEWFNFHHSHGLGVLAFGDEETSPAVRLLRYLKTNPTFFERHFALLGQAMHRSRQLDYFLAGDNRALAPLS